MSDTTFIYTLCEPGTRTIRYIGKANDPRHRLSQHLNRSAKLNNHLGCWLRKVGKPDLLILKEIPTLEWVWWEQSYISNAKMLGFNLVNSTSGGEGISDPSIETREKLSRANSGENHPQFGKKQSEGWIDTRIKAMTGLKRSEQSRRNISNGKLGRKFSLEHCRNISTSQKGKAISSGAREKISASLSGRKKPGASSSFLGVSRSKQGWASVITILNHSFKLGQYENEIDAAISYDWVAALYGRKLNFPKE